MKYKVGDKVVVEIEKVFSNNTGSGYCVVLGHMYSEISIGGKSEPLSTYTEPLEAKIRSHEAYISDLLLANERLSNEKKDCIEQARADGRSEAWELAQRICSPDGYSFAELKQIFNIQCGATEIFQNTYPEAAAKVEAWEKAKPLRTIFDDFLEKYPNALVNDERVPYACPYTLGYGEKIKDCTKKMNCFDCWNRPLEQIGEE